jgi:hypothetical protein
MVSTPESAEPTEPKRRAIWPWVAFWLFVVGMVALWIAAVYFVWWHPRGSLIKLPL